MINMIKADLYRIFKGKAIYICVILIVLLSVLSCYEMNPGQVGLQVRSAVKIEVTDKELLERVNETNSLQETREIMKEYGAFPVDKTQLGANANLYYFFIVVVVIVLVTDLSNSTVKNTLSSAISRKKYYLSKFITCLLLCTGLIIVNNYGSYIINLWMNGSQFSAGIVEITKITLLQIPIMYGIISLLVCIGFIFQKTATFNGITIPFLMMVQLVLMGIATLFHFDADLVLKYEFQYILMNLVSEPEMAYVMQIMGLSFLYIVVFHVIGYSVFQKAEIK